MNLLLTCAGRRGHTIAAFKHAVGPEGQVLACDAAADAPALQQADRALIVPSVDAPNYVDALLALCREHQVRLLIPALEPELPLLAAARARFAKLGTIALVSSTEVTALCYDKLATAEFLAAAGLPVPRTWLSLEAARAALRDGEVRFPLVLKPRWGVSSIGLSFPVDDEELELSFHLTAKQVARTLIGGAGAEVLIQERLSGQEYGLDIVNDLEGRHVCTFSKRKLRMRAGQTDRAVTVDDPALASLGRTIGERLGHVGPLDCDVFVTPAGCYAIDLNPRLGGGYPFSHLAGADLPAALVAWAEGRIPDPAFFQCRPGVTSARADAFIAMK